MNDKKKKKDIQEKKVMYTFKHQVHHKGLTYSQGQEYELDKETKDSLHGYINHCCSDCEKKKKCKNCK